MAEKLSLSAKIRNFFKFLHKKNGYNQQDNPLKSEAIQKTRQEEQLREKKTLNQTEIQKKLNGTTLMVYFVLLNKNQIGVRDLQRNLELSSPSVARYHLDKLVELNLVDNRNGVYHLINKADIPVLSTWVLMGKWLFPRSIFIALFATCFYIGYLGFIFVNWNRDSAIVIIFGAMMVLYLWYDVFYHFKHKPI